MGVRSNQLLLHGPDDGEVSRKSRHGTPLIQGFRCLTGTRAPTRPRSNSADGLPGPIFHVLADSGVSDATIQDPAFASMALKSVMLKTTVLGQVDGHPGRTRQGVRPGHSEELSTHEVRLTDLSGQIDEITAHRSEPLDEFVDVVRARPGSTARVITGRLHRSRPKDEIRPFLPSQAAGGTMAHGEPVDLPRRVHRVRDSPALSLRVDE